MAVFAAFDFSDISIENFVYWLFTSRAFSGTVSLLEDAHTSSKYTKTNDTIKTFNYPDMRAYATMADIDGLREDLSKSINTLKTKIGAK